MSIGIQISSINFNNHLADISFYPDTGGTVNFGYNLIPYTTELDYVYGSYELYFSADNRTCYTYISNPNTDFLLQENYSLILQEDNFGILLSGSPTPTPTQTSTPSETPIASSSETPTPTPTPTNSETPTQTPTNTPSVTPTNPSRVQIYNNTTGSRTITSMTIDGVVENLTSGTYPITSGNTGFSLTHGVNTNINGVQFNFGGSGPFDLYSYLNGALRNELYSYNNSTYTMGGVILTSTDVVVLVITEPGALPTPTPTTTSTNTPTPSTTSPFVSSGLIIELDADNTSSYPGAGTNVFNLRSIGTYTHTLTDAPYTVLNGIKCFDCNGGVNTSVRVNGVGPTLPTSGYTYITWARVKTSSAGYRTLFRTAPNDHPILVDVATDNLGFYDNDTPGFYDSGYDVTPVEDVWVQYTVVGDNVSSIFYINGTQVGTTAKGAGGNRHDYWGSIPGQPFGYVANMYYYDRKLNLSEITQQYNFLSPRFV